MALSWSLVVAVVLAAIRLYESVKQLSQTPEVTTVIGRVWQIMVNFMFDIENYKAK